MREGYLVDFYEPYTAQTGFQREGIKWAQLTEEQQNQLLQEGRDPDSIDWEGTELEKKSATQTRFGGNGMRFYAWHNTINRDR